MRVPSELSDLDSVVSETLLETADDFGDQSFHRSDVDYLERFDIDSSVVSPILAQSLQDRQHRDICLSSASRCTHEQILWRLERRLIQLALDHIKRLHI